MNKLLFVCTGNTCRSPMAEGLLKKMAMNENKSLDIYSAGIYANAGSGASEKAVVACAENGVDISKHISKGVSLKLLNDVDLILTMTTAHKQLLIQNVPQVKYKVHTLKEYNGNSQSLDVGDPFGQNLEIYRKCVNELMIELGNLMMRI